MIKEKIWSEGGHGTTDHIESYKDREKLHFHVLNSGKISRSRFISIVSKITKKSKSELYEQVMFAGNDKQFLQPSDDDKIVFTARLPKSVNDVLLKFDFDGNLIWMRNDMSNLDKKMIFEKYGELKE